MTYLDVNIVADYIINYFQSRAKEINPFKLQCMLYYVQGWYLGINQKKLFDEDFEGWSIGPYLKKIFDRFEHLQGSDIKDKSKLVELDLKYITHIDKVLEIFGDLDQYELEVKMHNEIAWRWSRDKLLTFDKSSRPLDNDIIRASFHERADEDNFKLLNNRKLNISLSYKKNYWFANSKIFDIKASGESIHDALEDFAYSIEKRFEYFDKIDEIELDEEENKLCLLYKKAFSDKN